MSETTNGQLAPEVPLQGLRQMIIGLSYDLKDKVPDPQGKMEDALVEYDSTETVDAIARVIEAHNHSVVKLGGGREFLNNVLGQKIDFVFNFAEGLGNYRSREAQVPAVLEMLGVPYSGSDPLSLACDFGETADQETGVLCRCGHAKMASSQ